MRLTIIPSLGSMLLFRSLPIYRLLSALCMMTNSIRTVAEKTEGNPTIDSGKVTGMKDYSGWKIVRVDLPVGENPSGLMKILLQSNEDIVVLNEKMLGDKIQVDLALSPNVKLNDILSSNGYQGRCLDDVPTIDNSSYNGRQLQWRTLDWNLQKSLTRSTLQTTNKTFSWDNYYSYDSIQQYSQALSNNYSFVEYIDIGETFEGRTLFALIFSTQSKRMAKKFKANVLNTDRYKKHIARHNNRRPKRSEARKRKVGGKYNKRKSRAQRPGNEGDKNKLLDRRENRHHMIESRTKKHKGKKSHNAKGKKVKETPANEIPSLNNPGRPYKKLKENKKEEKKKKMKNEKKKKKKKKKTTSVPVIYIEAGAHAREWISPAVATYLAQQIADAGRIFLKEVTVILVPIANPDGYEYSRNYDRLWRKNRSNTSLVGSWGVDLNRNWGIEWNGTEGSSDRPQDNIYRGAEPFSEAETRALRDLALVYSKGMQLYISLHSYGEALIYPWAYHTEKPSTKWKLRNLAEKITQSLNRNGGNYTHNQASHLFYVASGTSLDYLYSIGVPYSYTLELPYDSFFLPVEDILPVAEQVWSAFVCAVGHVAKTKRA